MLLGVIMHFRRRVIALNISSCGQVTEFFCGNARVYSEGLYVIYDNATASDNRSLSNVYAFHHLNSMANEYIIVYFYRRAVIVSIATVINGQSVEVGVCDKKIWAYQTTLSDVN